MRLIKINKIKNGHIWECSRVMTEPEQDGQAETTSVQSLRATLS